MATIQSERLPTAGPIASPSSQVIAKVPRIRIEAKAGWRAINLAELWNYRELLYFLAWRDIKVRYKQTILGAFWAILQPVVSMAVFSVVFGELAGMKHQTGDIPYPIFVYAGLLPWNLFAGGFCSASASVLNNQNLITKVYFPRLLLPLSAVAVKLVDFGIAFLVLIAMMLWYGIAPGPAILLLPLLTCLIVLATLGVASLFAGLTVAYRDFLHVTGFVSQVWFYFTPVIYPKGLVPGSWQWVMNLNPIGNLIEVFRGALLGKVDHLSLQTLLLTGCLTLLLFLGGVFWFRREEKRFADFI